MINRLAATFVMVALAAALLVAPASAAAPKTYQVTGPVVELNADTIVVMKGKDRWEIARDATTKVTGDLKVGSKVTITYRMSATAIDVKPDTASKAKKGATGTGTGTN
jgi:hypothetical protein